MKKIILASQSTNRKRLLAQLGLDFEVIPSNYEEDMTLNMPPHELAMHLAKGKAMDVAKNNPNAVVIGADTFFVFEDKIAGKPKDNQQALEMLQNLRGNEHKFVTGFTVAEQGGGKIIQDYAETTILMRADLTDKQLKNYIATEHEPVTTKAGAYDGFGKGIILIEHFNGDFSAALGLPLTKLSRALEQFDIKII